MTAISLAVEERGQTTVTEPTVARIAAHALTELSDIGGAARAVLGIAIGADAPDREARVTARMSGDRVHLTVRLSVAYPTSVRTATASARSHLTDRVGALTGLTVSDVDIVVTELYQERQNTRRVT